MTDEKLCGHSSSHYCGCGRPVYNRTSAGTTMTMFGSHICVLKVQSSAVITRSNIVRYYMNNYKNWGRISSRCWIYKRHPIPRPNGRAMGCILWVYFVRKNDRVITALHCIFISVFSWLSTLSRNILYVGKYLIDGWGTKPVWLCLPQTNTLQANLDRKTFSKRCIICHCLLHTCCVNTDQMLTCPIWFRWLYIQVYMQIVIEKSKLFVGLVSIKDALL